MTKHLSPPMRMRIERGHLVPATAYDQERLDSYRNGSTVSVRFTADRMRPLERKYRAILGKVVKECQTPWTNAEAAHQAIKLACGYVNVGRTKSGDFMQWPRSIMDFDDAEMEDYFERALEVMSEVTRVDPETLKRETAHVDAEDDEIIDPETGEITPNPNPGAAPSPASAGTDESGTISASSNEPDQTSSLDPGSNDGSASNSAEDTAGPSSSIPEKELLLLRRFARDVLNRAANPETDGAVMSKVINRWINMDLVNVQSEAGKAAVNSIRGSVKGLMKAEVEFKSVIEIHAEGLGCEPAELMVSDNG